MSEPPGRSGPLTGRVRLPGDKSITHRALLVAALARGRSVLDGANRGHDAIGTMACLRALGVGLERDESKGQVAVYGSGFEGLGEPEDILDAGNSGTTLRCLLGLCAGLEASVTLTGDATLRRRPMLRVVAPLRRMGARIDGRSRGELAPLHIRGGGLAGIDVELPVASAQVKTALLVAGLAAEGRTTVHEPGVSRDHTERMLAAAGVPLERGPGRVTVAGGGRPQARRWSVPGDISSGFFLLVAACLVPGSELVLERVGLNPTRTGAVEVLRRMGARLEVETDAVVGGEPVGRIVARSSPLRATTVGPAEVPMLIDEIPALAVAATQAEGETVITGAAELRVKESDRIAATVAGIVALGGRAEALADGLAVTGPTPLGGGAIASCGDHRIALAFAVAGLAAAGPVHVDGWGCVDTSFPEFEDLLRQVSGPSR